jgi:hypothetical protein
MEVDERTKEAAMEIVEAEDATAGQAELTVEAEASDAVETSQEDEDGIELSFEAEDRTKGPLEAVERTDVVEIKMEAESPAPSPASLMFDSGMGLVFAGVGYLLINYYLLVGLASFVRCLLSYFCSVADPGCFSRIRFFPPGISDPASNTKKNFCQLTKI